MKKKKFITPGVYTKEINMKIHDWEICRNIYKTMRLNGCPSVTIRQFSSDIFYGETSDGKFHLEYIKNQCCKWAMKVEVLTEYLKWKELFDEQKHF